MQTYLKYSMLILAGLMLIGIVACQQPADQTANDVPEPESLARLNSTDQDEDQRKDENRSKQDATKESQTKESETKNDKLTPDSETSKLEKASEKQTYYDHAQANEKRPERQTIDIPASWKRLSKQHEIWVDKTAKQVIVAGEVCLTQGPLEMFICPQGTKEHESVISANALSSEVHGALLFLGADPGKPCAWDPKYRPAYGPKIEVTLMWREEKSKKTITKSARQWIRNVHTGKPLDHDWVFGGSQIWVDPDTKEQVYYGDSGEMICLSNFSTASIDLNIESSDSNAGLLFEAFTENIPPIGTKVYAVITPGEVIGGAKKEKIDSE